MTAGQPALPVQVTHRAHHGGVGDFPLNAPARIQLEVGKPLTAPTSITWPNGLQAASWP